MTAKDLRKKFIEFFTAPPRNHKEIPSASLVPENDPSSLFTSSGMQPLINYLLGEKHPLGTRLVNSQKCFRSQDIDEVGDNRHTTFFEMLGNWSLGDYFKKEQIPWIYEFLTKKLKLDPERLYISVFEGTKEVPRDEESVRIWKSLGVQEERIFYYGVKKNWWSRSGEPENMPAGEPGGPDSEVFFDLGKERLIHENSPYKDQKCHPNCECGRFLEIANSVFMQYQKQADGTLKELPNKNVDFGGGLERLVAAVNDDPDIFKVDIFQPIIREIIGSQGIVIDPDKIYGPEDYPVHPILHEAKDTQRLKEQVIKSVRIIADHLRAATFILAEGIEPSNKTQGYVSRRLIRRSILHSRNLGINGNFTNRVAKSVISVYKDTYPQLKTVEESIYTKIDSEESRFRETLEKGLKEFDKYITAGEVGKPETQKKILSPRDIFFFYETYGFPYEISKEEASKRGIEIPTKEEFDLEFQKHQELSRTATRGIFKGGLQDQSEITTKLHTATHLLQQALRIVLGDHVRQKGSHITAERLRFDFSHPNKLTSDEIKKVEALVNEQIKLNLPISMKIQTLEQAMADKALTVPGANYPEKVKVYSVGNFSKEVCGGPHVDFTGKLGTFKIIKEEASGSNVRRIYAILEQ
jgi:alanyl-tRNA synthetase